MTLQLLLAAPRTPLLIAATIAPVTTLPPVRSVRRGSNAGAYRDTRYGWEILRMGAA